MFAGNVVAVKVRRCLLAMRPFHEQPDRFPLRGSTRCPARAPHVRWRSATTSSPSFLLARSPAESHLARWRRPDHRPPRVTDSASQQIQAPHPWSYGVSRRRSPDPRKAPRAGETRSCRHTRCRPAPAQPATRPQWHAHHLDPQLGLGLERHLVGDVGLGPPRWILGPSSRAGTARSQPATCSVRVAMVKLAATWQIGDLADLWPEYLSLHAHGVPCPASGSPYRR